MRLRNTMVISCATCLLLSSCATPERPSTETPEISIHEKELAFWTYMVQREANVGGAVRHLKNLNAGRAGRHLKNLNVERAVRHLKDLDDPRALPTLYVLAKKHRPTGCDDALPSVIYEAIESIEGGVRFRRVFSETDSVQQRIEACSQIIGARRHASDRCKTERETRRLLVGGRVPDDIRKEVQFWAAAEQRAVGWLLKQDDPRAMDPLCRVATRSKVKKRLRAQGMKARPYLLAECKHGRSKPTSACLRLLAELKDNADISFVGRFLYAGTDDDGAKLGGAAALALPCYGQASLSFLRKASLDANSKMAVRRAACALWLIGGEKAEAVLRDALVHHQSNPAVDTETIRVLKYYLGKLQKKAEPAVGP